MAKKKMRKKREPQKPQGFTPTYEELQTKLNKTRWGNTELHKFISDAHRNSLMSSFNLRAYMGLSRDLVDAFRKIITTLGYTNEGEAMIASLFGRSCGNYLASVRLISSGQLTEGYPQLRACIESALYAYYMHGEDALIKAWTDRQKSEEARKECRKLFQHKKVVGRLKKDNPTIGNDADVLYQNCIDYGAHPTELSNVLNWKLAQKGGRRTLQLQLLNCDDGFMRGSLVLCADVGLRVLSIFGLVYPNEYKDTNMSIVLSNIRSSYTKIAITTSQILKTQVNEEKKSKTKKAQIIEKR